MLNRVKALGEVLKNVNLYGMTDFTFEQIADRIKGEYTKAKNRWHILTHPNDVPTAPPITWITPGGQVWTIYDDMTAQPHLLVSGTTGSGKSVVINGIVHAILHRAPCQAGLILIDPKRVELAQFKALPHTIYYASEPWNIVEALRHAIEITEARYTEMHRTGEKLYTGPDLYVLIDELADILTTNKKAIQPLLQRLCQIGRAARVHVVAGTQCPLASIISTPIKVNFDARVGLRTRSAQDSRNILGMKGCEALPRYGFGYYMKPEGTALYQMPMVSAEELNELCMYWQSDKCKRTEERTESENEH